MWLLAAEFAALFIGLPTAYRLKWVPLPMIPFLLLVMIGCAVYLVRDRAFDRRLLWNADSARSRLPLVLATFAVSSALVGALVAVFAPDHLFTLVKRSPALWVLIILLYPLFSVYPQELVYRTFLFHRYRPLFPRAWMRVAASAAAFGYMHIVFQNGIAVLMTLVGGAIFAYTYERSHSTLLAAIEHALYGCFVFTIGLGAYFYGGNVR